MWFECSTCSYATNSPRLATEHEKTGHYMIVEVDWTDNEEEVF